MLGLAAALRSLHKTIFTPNSLCTKDKTSGASKVTVERGALVCGRIFGDWIDTAPHLVMEEPPSWSSGQLFWTRASVQSTRLPTCTILRIFWTSEAFRGLGFEVVVEKGIYSIFSKLLNSPNALNLREKQLKCKRSSNVRSARHSKGTRASTTRHTKTKQKLNL